MKANGSNLTDQEQEREKRETSLSLYIGRIHPSVPSPRRASGSPGGSPFWRESESTQISCQLMGPADMLAPERKRKKACLTTCLTERKIPRPHPPWIWGLKIGCTVWIPKLDHGLVIEPPKYRKLKQGSVVFPPRYGPAGYEASQGESPTPKRVRREF